MSPAAKEAIGSDVCADLARLVQRREDRAHELAVARSEFESQCAELKGALTSHRNAAGVAQDKAEDYRLRCDAAEAGNLRALEQVHALKAKLAAAGATLEIKRPPKEEGMSAENYPIQSQYVRRDGDTATLVLEIKVGDVIETWTVELEPRE